MCGVAILLWSTLGALGAIGDRIATSVTGQLHESDGSEAMPGVELTGSTLHAIKIGGKENILACGAQGR